MAEYNGNGLTREAFTKRKGIDVHTFDASLLQQRRSDRGTAARFEEMPWTGLAATPSLEVAELAAQGYDVTKLRRIPQHWPTAP